MPPLWPFIHGGIEYRLDGSSGIYFCAHGLGKKSVPGYVNTATSNEWSALQPKSQTYLERNVFLDFNNRYNARMTDGWVSKIVSSTLTLLRISELKNERNEHVRGIIGHINVMSGNAEINLSNITCRAIKLCFSRLVKRLDSHASNVLNTLE